MRFRAIIAAVALASSTTAALARDPVVQPVQVGEETVRFDHAVPTLDLQRPHGAVQITPLPMDHGGLVFGVAVYNAGGAPANFDIDAIIVHAGAEPVAVLSRHELEAKAKKRAMWATIAVAALGGISAAASASQRDYYHSTLITPHGAYRSTFSAPSVAGEVQAAAITAGTGVGLAAIQNQLDATRAAIGASTVQLTTVDPGESYAGRIVLTKIKQKALPQRVDLLVRWNGEEYPFAFQLAKDGTPMPVFHALTPPRPAPPGTPDPAPSEAPAATS